MQILSLVEVVVVAQVKVTRRRRRKLALTVQGAQLAEAVADGISGLEELVAEGLAEDLTDLVADVDLDVGDLKARGDVLGPDILAYKREHAVANVVGEVLPFTHACFLHVFLGFAFVGHLTVIVFLVLHGLSCPLGVSRRSSYHLCPATLEDIPL